MVQKHAFPKSVERGLGTALGINPLSRNMTSESQVSTVDSLTQQPRLREQQDEDVVVLLGVATKVFVFV